MKAKSIYIAISIALLTISFVSCNEETLYDGPCKVRFVAEVQDEVNVTRAAEGYTALPYSADFSAGLYVSYGATAQPYTMSWDDKSKLSANLWLETGNYGFYGYAPQTDGALFDNSTKKLSIPYIPGLSNTDLMVINPRSATVTSEDLLSGKKTVSLQMDHLMAKITPCFYLNETYAAMRDIKITKVEFSLSVAATYTANVDYDASSYTTTWEPGATTNTSVTAFSNTDGTNNLPTAKTNALAVGHCYIVPTQSTATLKMKVTYDVYDKKGVKTRTGEAENSIKKLPASLEAGKNYLLNIQIIPTYLYVLSDNDESSVLVIPNN